MIVDSHHHFWDPERGDYPWMTGPAAPIRRRFGPEDLAPALRECGVDRTVLVQTWASLEETREFLQVAGAASFVAGVIGWVDLTAEDVAGTIDDLLKSKNGRFLVGIRHQVHDEADQNWVLRPEVERGIVAVGEAGLVYDLLVRPRELPAALELARRHPEITFVIDHIAKPDIVHHAEGRWAGDMAALSDLHNVHCKLSGMVTEADWTKWRPEDLEPYVNRVIEWFGTGRVMYGSDWPVCLLAGSYQQVFDALQHCIRHRPRNERARVMGENAIAVYRLQIEPPPHQPT